MQSIKSQGLPYPLLLTLGVVIAASPGFFLAPYSIHLFDEPYQILNAYDWRDSVYSPLSAFLGHIVGCVFGWKYLVFRRLLIVLTTLSIYFPALYALRLSRRKNWIVWVSMAAVYFATVFKSDMNIYGWDNWTFLFISFLILISISLCRKWAVSKLIFLALMSGLTVLLRLPNACVVVVVAVILLLYQFKKEPLGKIVFSECLYVAVALFSAWVVLVCLYGSFGNYLMLFSDNSIESHSPVFILQKLSLSFFYTMRFLFLVVVGLAVIYFSATKFRLRWIGWLSAAMVSVGFFLLLFPLSRDVLGNIAEYCISIVLSGIAVVLYRGFKNGDRELVDVGFTILLLCLVPLVGSNWGFYKYMSWPAVPLLAWIICRRLTAPIKLSCYALGAALLAFSFCSFTRPTFFDGRLNTLTHPLYFGVLDGMYTSESQGTLVDEVVDVATPYLEHGYEVIPIRWKNGYLWEYLFLKRNPHMRHRFDYLEAFDDETYVDKVLSDVSESEVPVAVLLFKSDDKTEDNLMFRTLETNLLKVKDTPDYTLFVSG